MQIARIPGDRMDANSTAGSSQINYSRIDYFGPAPHYKHPSGDRRHRSGLEPARYHPAMLSGVPGGPGGTAPRILIVDDDPNLLVLLAEQLRSDGYEIATARDGEEALRRLQASWPDLLIIDMMMPRMDGLSLAREIKSRADLPIIVLSAIDAERFEGGPPRGGGRGLHHQAVPLPGAPGADQPGDASPRRQGSRARASSSVRTSRSTCTAARRPSARPPSS